MSITKQVQSLKIAALNDALRITGRGGRLCATRSVTELPRDIVHEALDCVRTFEDFTEDNDPHGEHDFGAFQLAGNCFFWKIDYYDKALECGSDNPADPAVTTRVLTLMLAEDY